MAETHSFTHDTVNGGQMIYYEADTVDDSAAAELRVLAADGGEQIIRGRDADQVYAKVETDHLETPLAYDVYHSPLRQIAETQRMVRTAIDAGLEDKIGN